MNNTRILKLKLLNEFQPSLHLSFTRVFPTVTRQNVLCEKSSEKKLRGMFSKCSIDDNDINLTLFIHPNKH